MNLYRLAVLLLRLWGIDWIIGGLMWLLYVPGVALEIANVRPGAYFLTHIEISIAAHVFHAVFDVAAGIGLIVWSKPIASFLSRFTGEIRTSELEQRIWPPPPRHPITIEIEGSSPLFGQDRTSILRTAIVFLRVDGLTWLIGTVLEMEDLPYDIMGLLNQRAGYWKAQYVLSISVAMMRTLIRIGVGLYFLFLQESLAKRVTDDLVRDAESESELSTTMPPPESVP